LKRSDRGARTGHTIWLVSRERISACLIVQNEQERLTATLESIAFCDEMIVVDGGSTDRTVEIARAAGATVIENLWPGFAAQRNMGLDAATGEWILEIDADERVSEQLHISIEGLLAAEASGVEMAVCPLRNHFLGRPLGPSAKYPGYRARMFRRGAYRHDEGRMVHEGIEPRRRPFVLDGDLEHELAATLREALLDAWRYARLESRHLARSPRLGAYLAGIGLRPAAKLLYRTVLEGGWRDGWRGLLKISLDVTSDALVWTLVLLRGQPASAGRDAGRSEHFGRRPSGSVKVVAIASGEGAVRAAIDWLAGLQARGLDVALIAEGPGVGEQARAGGQADENVPVHPLERLRPLAVMRALDVEMQLRTTDAVIFVGRRARLVRRLLPRTLRPEIPRLSVDVEPELAVNLADAGVPRR
jgi:hypothetical protein